MSTTQSIVEARLIGRPYRYFETVTSTMDAAREWIAQGAPDRAIVIAGSQSAGRGRIGRKWVNAGASALAFSQILRLETAALPQLPMYGGLAVYEALNALHVPDLMLKWPNDILIGTRKVSGVLVETAWDGDRLNGAILGIGLNISGSFGSPDLAESATSLADVPGTGLGYGVVLSALIDHLDARHPDLGTSRLYDAWHTRLGTIGRRVRVEGSPAFEGIAEDVNEIGALLVRSDDGQLRTVLAGDVRVRPA